MNKIMGREPAVFFGLIAGLALAIIQLANVTDPLAGALNAVVLAAAGLATAAVVDVDKVLPALIGLTTATFAVFLAYGSPVPENTQAGILALIAAGAAFFVRQNVVAPVSAGVSTAENKAWHLGRQAGFEESSDANIPAEAPGEHSDGPDFTGRLA